MSEQCTLADLRRVVGALKRNSIKPHVVKTAEEADEINAIYAELGLQTRFKVGDEYYEMTALASINGASL